MHFPDSICSFEAKNGKNIIMPQNNEVNKKDT